MGYSGISRFPYPQLRRCPRALDGLQSSPICQSPQVTTSHTIPTIPSTFHKSHPSILNALPLPGRTACHFPATTVRPTNGQGRPQTASSNCPLTVSPPAPSPPHTVLMNPDPRQMRSPAATTLTGHSASFCANSSATADQDAAALSRRILPGQCLCTNTPHAMRRIVSEAQSQCIELLGKVNATPDECQMPPQTVCTAPKPLVKDTPSDVQPAKPRL